MHIPCLPTATTASRSKLFFKAQRAVYSSAINRPCIDGALICRTSSRRQMQHVLGEDIALDLVTSAINRRRPRVDEERHHVLTYGTKIDVTPQTTILTYGFNREFGNSRLNP